MKSKGIMGLLLAAMLLFTSGCGSGQGAALDKKQNDVEADADAAAEIDLTQKEAPMLAEKVAAGELPALEERLPVAGDIMVEPDVKSLGKYGGSMSVTTLDNGRWQWGYYSEQSMFRFKQDGSNEVEANVCKDFYPNEDASVWTIELREGMKWSDGAPFTADDVLFYYEHCSTPAINPDRTAVDASDPNYYSAFTSKNYDCFQVLVDGVHYWAEMEKIDDYKLTVNFKAPKPDFPVRAAVDAKWMFLPKHFFVDILSRKDGVTDDPSFPAISEEEALANANAKFNKQWTSYSAMGKDTAYYHWGNYIIPQLRSFIAVKDNWDTVGETYVMVRNPYFWKTDSEGRQLPYLDQIEVKIINEMDQITLKVMSGDIDFYNANADFSTVASALQDSHDVYVWQSSDWASEEVVMLNQTVKDADKRNMFQNRDFRQALSLAVDRNLLNETVHNGICKPAQASVPKGMFGYDEEWSRKWTDYDVDKANQLLDGVTEPWNRAPGTFRKMKGTNRDAEIILSVKEPKRFADYLSILESFYKNVGVKLISKADPDSRIAMLSNDVEASFELFNCVGANIRPDALVPVRNVSFWHAAYGKWYEDGKSTAGGGVEPTGDVLELILAYEAIQTATGQDREKVVQENVQKIYDLHKENVWVIGYLSPVPARHLINKAIRNMPDNMILSDEYRFGGLARPEQFWRDDL